jgi:hypothetical protein
MTERLSPAVREALTKYFKEAEALANDLRRAGGKSPDEIARLVLKEFPDLAECQLSSIISHGNIRVSQPELIRRPGSRSPAGSRPSSGRWSAPPPTRRARAGTASSGPGR